MTKRPLTVADVFAAMFHPSNMGRPKPRHLPVIFRNEGTVKAPSIVAIFPTEPGTNDWATFTVYSHVGQHATGTKDWYRTTKPVTPEQYADLLHELSGIYERDDRDRVLLLPHQRFTQAHDEKRRAALRKTGRPA